MKRIIAMLLCLCMVLPLLSGCQTEDPESYVPTGDALLMEDEEEIYQVEDDGTQSFSLAYYPVHGLNPLYCTDYTNRMIFPLVYQGLFSVNRENEVVPILCESYTVSADQRIHSFKIRSNATFSNGVPVTADEVVDSLHNAWGSSFYTGRMKYFESIYAEDSKTLVISTTQAYGDISRLLDIPIVKWNEATGLFWGSGPYVFAGTEGNYYLARNDNWWCKSNDLQVTAQRIPLKEVHTVVEVRDSFEFDDVGVVCTDPGSDRYTEYRCDYELWDCETGIFLYLGFNMSSPLFQHVAIRQALVRGIDRHKLADQFYRGFATPAELPVSPKSNYYSETLAQNYAYDEAQFLSQMAANGVQGRSIRLLVNSDDSLRVSVAQEIANSLNACGLIVTVDAYGGEIYKNLLASGAFDLYLAQTKLSPNMDLTSFFSANGSLSYGIVSNINVYNLSLQALENEGNVYNLCKAVMDEALICPILFRSYAVYAARGLLTDLAPARDNVFFYTIQA